MTWHIASPRAHVLLSLKDSLLLQLHLHLTRTPALTVGNTLDGTGRSAAQRLGEAHATQTVAHAPLLQVRLLHEASESSLIGCPVPTDGAGPTTRRYTTLK
jgi:hypothetical protein